jgi:hypothetical protein
VYSEYEESWNRRRSDVLQLANAWMRLLQMSKSKRILFKVPASTKLNTEFLVAPLSFYHILQRLTLKGKVGHRTSCILDVGADSPP